MSRRNKKAEERARLETERLDAAADVLTNLIGVTETLRVLDKCKRRVVRENRDRAEGWIA